MKLIITISIFSFFFISCSGKADLVFSPRNSLNVGKGKSVKITVIDKRIDKEFSKDPAGSISLDKSPENIFLKAISRGLSSQGYKVNQNSELNMIVQIDEFYVKWRSGINVNVTSEISLIISIIKNNKYLLRNKKINSYLSERASGGGFPAIGVAEGLVQKTFSESINKLLDNQDIFQNLVGLNKSNDLEKIEVENQQLEKYKAVIIPTGIIGDIKNSQIQIIINKFLDELSNDYDIVPQEEYEKAEEAAFQEMNYEECTEDQCIRLIQEMLQVENMFQIQLIREERDTQVSLILIDLDRKLVKTDFCEDCKTSSLIQTISKLYRELQKKR